MAPRLPILLLLAAVALYAETPAQQCNRAWVLIQQHKHLEAFQLLKTTIRENPTFVRAYRLVGDACGPGACREEALQFLSAAGPGPREVALGHYGRGSVYAANPAYSKGGLAPALREFAACIRVDPSRAECYPGVGGSLQAVAPATLTLRHAERLAPIDPHNPATRLLEGRILNLARKLEQAQQVLSCLLYTSHYLVDLAVVAVSCRPGRLFRAEPLTRLLWFPAIHRHTCLLGCPEHFSGRRF